MITHQGEYQSRYFDKALEAMQLIEDKSGKGGDLLGWVDYPSKVDSALLDQIYSLKEKWEDMGVDLVVVVGVGGSFLGAKSVIKALSPYFSETNEHAKLQIIFAGFNLSADYLSQLIEVMKLRSCAAVVISKSGTTLEPTITFDFVKKILEEKYTQEGASQRICAITDAKEGLLREEVDKYNYTSFSVPSDMGGRYSIFSPVGLLPIALAGYDIREFIEGAKAISKDCVRRDRTNPALNYAAFRSEQYFEKEKKLEILVSYETKLEYIADWWKQLFGESEGKQHRGIYPSKLSFTRDLHSVGQYIQEGERIIFETILSVKQPPQDLVLDGPTFETEEFKFLYGKTLNECNKFAEVGVTIAHREGGVPIYKIEIESINEYNLGELFYMFEYACAISAYILDVNPFDQPGVEEYKKNIYRLLK